MQMAPGDVSELDPGSGFPTAPLFTTHSLTADEASDDVEKIDFATAVSTLNALDKIIRSFEVKDRPAIPTSKPHPLFARIFSRQGWFVLCSLMFASLFFAAGALYLEDEARLTECEDQGLPSGDWHNTNTGTELDTQLASQGLLQLDLRTVCSLTTGKYWHGAARWRWLLFFALWPPLGVVGQCLASVISAMVVRFEGSGVFLALAMDHPLGCVFRSVIWTALWRPIMETPIAWANKADAWNDQATAQVWVESFEDVNKYMRRVLLAYVLLEIASLLRQAASKYLELQFHHKKFFKTMQKALVQESAVKRLSGPVGAHPMDSSVPTSQNTSEPLTGVDRAHWAALKFVTRLLDGALNVMLDGYHHHREQRTGVLRTRAENIQRRLAVLLAKSINKKRMQAASESASLAAANSIVRSVTGPPVDAEQPVKITADAISRAAVESLGAHGPDRGSMVLEVAVSEAAISSTLELEDIDSAEDSTATLALNAAQAIQTLKMEPKQAYRDIAAHLAAPESAPTTRVWFWVNKMQVYLTRNPHMEVLMGHSVSDNDEQQAECVTSPKFAKQVGYYIFFNLKGTDDQLTLSEKNVVKAEKEANLDHAKSWRLFNRDGDKSATLQEVIDGTLRLYTARETLTRTLLGNVAVVKQVERAIGAVMLIFWVFVAAAIFDPDAVQRTWTALSAGLLSFSFVFSNTIRQIFENTIYLFFVQPFNPSDLIIFDGARYSVGRITLLSVELARGDGAAITVPTAALREAQVHNISRSGVLQEELRFSVINTTPHIKLQGLAHHVQSCINAHPKLYHGTYTMWWSAASRDMLTLSIAFYYKGSGEDLLQTQIAKTHMYNAVAQGMEKLGIRNTSSQEILVAREGPTPTEVSAPSMGAGRSHGPPEGLDVVQMAAGAGLLGQT